MPTSDARCYFATYTKRERSHTRFSPITTMWAKNLKKTREPYKRNLICYLLWKLLSCSISDKIQLKQTIRSQSNQTLNLSIYSRVTYGQKTDYGVEFGVYGVPKLKTGNQLNIYEFNVFNFVYRQQQSVQTNRVVYIYVVSHI